LAKFGKVTAMKGRFDVVRAWHEAVNQGDADKLVALSSDDIEIGGPRGSASGSVILRDWLNRARIRLEPRRWFAGPDLLVVEQVATWRAPEGGMTDPDTIASSFQVEKGMVSKMVRFDSLEDALVACGLTEQDEISNTSN
jgi:hypothetical protein